MRKEMKTKLLWLLGDFVLATFLIFLDQWTKSMALTRLKGKAPYILWKNIFELDYLENRGSAFGLFQNQKIFLLLVGVFFVVLITWLLIRMPNVKRFLPLHFLGAAIMAGGIGNMIDRFIRGYVVDFFSFVLIHFPVFNVADVYITVSTFALAVLLIFVYKDEELQVLWPGKLDTKK